MEANRLPLWEKRLSLLPGTQTDRAGSKIVVKTAMNFFQIDPTQDARWSALVAIHPKASVFHTVGWLKTLQSTYGYEPVAFTTSSPSDELKNGLVFCRVNSWLTGRRLVSLPFSDHCEPLSDSADELNFLIRHLQTAVQHEKWKYMEIRPKMTVDFATAGDGIDLMPAATHFNCIFLTCVRI